MQRIGFERHAHIGHAHNYTGVSCCDDTDLLGANKTLGGLNARHRALCVATNALHFAILDDIDTHRTCGARITPGYRVMSRGTAATLQGRTQNRVAHIGRDVEDGAEFLSLFGRQPLIVDALQTVGMDVALEHLNVMHRVGQHHYAARGIHDVVIEFCREVFPEFNRMLVKPLAFFPEIIRANNRGVAARIAAAEPALL